MKLNEKLLFLQKNLKVPKGQFNKFGNYAYRSCEDILEAIKPLLDGLTLRITDEIVEVGGRIYVKATVIISDGEDTIMNTAYAREPENKKGADESQITGGTSSYARKYALNGLFLIDDTKDADATNTHGKEDVSEGKPKKLSRKTTKAEEAEETSSDKPKTSFRRRRT